MKKDPAAIADLHGILRAIGSAMKQISVLAQLRDESAASGDSHRADLWNWLATQMAAVRDADRRERGTTIAEWALPEKP